MALVLFPHQKFAWAPCCGVIHDTVVPRWSAL